MAIQFSWSSWQLKQSNLSSQYWLDYVQFPIRNLIQNVLIRGPCGALGITSRHRSHYYTLKLRSQTGPQPFLFGPQTKWGFVCFLNLNFLPRFKTVVPEWCSFSKVVPQGHGGGTVPLTCVPPASALCAFEFQRLETKCSVLTFKGAQHLTRGKILGSVVLAHQLYFVSFKIQVVPDLPYFNL